MKLLRKIHTLVFFGMLCLLLIACEGGDSITTNNYSERIGLRTVPQPPIDSSILDDDIPILPEIYKLQGNVRLEYSRNANAEFWSGERTDWTWGFDFSQSIPEPFESGNLYFHEIFFASSACYYLGNGGPFYCESQFNNNFDIGWAMFLFWLKPDSNNGQGSYGQGTYKECGVLVTGDECFNYLFNSPDGTVNVFVVK